MKQTIHIESADELVGKTIKWHAPGYQANGDYTGIDRIISVDTTKRRPFTTEVIEGDNLSFAFADKYTGGMVAYSDSDRLVTYEILDNVQN